MDAYRVIGIESSPYAVKVRAVMRYRHLPYVWIGRMPQLFAETSAVRPLIMPIVQFPNGEYRTDSTPIILDLERRHRTERSIVPDDQTAAFLSILIEDMADEWLTKSLFHHRFSHRVDALSGASWVMDDAHPGASVTELETLTDAFIERQTTRMPLVGCTTNNAHLIEKFYLDVLDALESVAATDRFLFGSRPALADFGLYGQLTTLAADPTARDIMLARAPRTARWVRRLDDASGVDGHWHEVDAPQSAAVVALVALAGRYYLPFLEANAHAIAAGAETVVVTLAGQQYVQPTYRYQAKCRDYLLSTYAGLPSAARSRLSSLLDDTDCLRYLQAAR